MSEGQTAPTMTAEQLAALDRMAQEFKAKDAEKAHNDMVENLCKSNDSFKTLHDKYKDEIFALNPTLKQTNDPNQFLTTFSTAATILFERDKKISASTTQTTTQTAAATTTPQTQTTTELDKPIPQGNGTFKNKAGEVVDEKGMKLLGEDVRLADLRNLEIPTDAAIDNATKARLQGIRTAQQGIKRFERPTW
jgi:hypothetical protein